MAVRISSHWCWLGGSRQRPSAGKTGLLLLLGALFAGAAPTWNSPTGLKLGELQVLELREDDPLKPALPRPTVEDHLGPLRLRAMEPLPDGHGWRFQVQALEPGIAMIPALDLGNGQRSPELRLEVPRSVPYGGPWVGFGGGNEDLLPAIPFPWGWASLLLVPPLGLAAWGIHRWRLGADRRHLHQALLAFRRQWPPRDRERATLDRLHQLGRELLAARFGEVARTWGPAEFQARKLGPWAEWAQSLDAARFGFSEPPFPALEPLVSALEERPPGRGQS